MIPTLKTRNTRICILLGQKNQRMGMLTLHDAERLQAQSLTFMHIHLHSACFPLSHVLAQMRVSLLWPCGTGEPSSVPVCRDCSLGPQPAAIP